MFKIAESLDIKKHLEYIHLLAKMLVLLHLFSQYPPAVVLFSDSILYKYDYHTHTYRERNHFICFAFCLPSVSPSLQQANPTKLLAKLNMRV